jgi:hypothetical protein
LLREKNTKGVKEGENKEAAHNCIKRINKK